MYRIHFDPNVGRFVIQVLVWGFIWESVRSLNEQGKKTSPLTFETYDDTVAHVQKMGLHTLYQDRSANKYREHIQRHDSYAR
jgi:hypothetical protein